MCTPLTLSRNTSSNGLQIFDHVDPKFGIGWDYRFALFVRRWSILADFYVVVFI